MAESKIVPEELFRLFQEIVHAYTERNERIFPEMLNAEIEKRTDQSAPMLSLLETHVLDLIGRNKDIKAIDISSCLGITRGGISKIITRLSKKGYLETQEKMNNKKEVTLKLTPLGKVAFDAHEQLHNKMKMVWQNTFEQYSDNDKAVLDRFAKDALLVFRTTSASSK